MQILANALPGFRDMRAPLTAGYLWLLFAWILARPDVSQPPENPVLRSAYELATGVGPVWVGIAVGTLAYFVGSVTQIVTDYLERRFSPSALVRRRMVREFEADPSHRHMRVRDMPSGVLIEETRMAVEEAIESASPTDAEQEKWEWRFQSGHREALDRATSELDLPATLLVGNEPALFAEVDRMRAEGELRITVAPPLILLTVLVALGWSPWVCCALFGVVALVWQGGNRKAESRQLIEDAMRTGRIESSASKAYKDSMDRLLAEIEATAVGRASNSAISGAALSAQSRTQAGEERHL